MPNENVSNNKMSKRIGLAVTSEYGPFVEFGVWEDTPSIRIVHK